MEKHLYTTSAIRHGATLILKRNIFLHHGISYLALSLCKWLTFWKLVKFYAEKEKDNVTFLTLPFCDPRNGISPLTRMKKKLAKPLWTTTHLRLLLCRTNCGCKSMKSWKGTNRDSAWVSLRIKNWQLSFVKVCMNKSNQKQMSYIVLNVAVKRSIH